MSSTHSEDFPNCNLCGIRNHAILRSADEETLDKINKGKYYNRFPKAGYVFRSGDKAEGFYFIRSGLVRNFRQSPGGKEQTFSIRGPGEWLGFRDALLGDMYYHSAECLEEVEACFIHKSLAQGLIREDVNFQTEVFKQMAREWRETESQVMSLGTKQVHSKLAELLLTLKKGSGDKSELELKIKREVLASIIGTKTETLVRALSDFKNRDIVRVDRNKIIINDTEALVSLSELEIA